MKKESTDTTLPPINFDLLDVQAYQNKLLSLLPKAKKRIVVAAMGVLWGNKTDPIFYEISQALQRGVQVHIMLDSYTRFWSNKPGQPRSVRLRYKKTKILLEELQQAGAHISVVGKIGLNPFKGRCHIKITVVDDHSFSFGGINFNDESFDNQDYLLYAKNTELAECLAQLVSRISGPQRPLTDAELPFANGQSILFDGGEPGHSIIYDRALELTAQAKRVWYVSQMTPNGLLVKAMQHTDTTFFFNLPSIMEVPSSWGQAFDQQRFRLVNSYTGQGYIHAKFMLFELTDGRRALLSGSNNFNYRGVAYGTQEIALYSTDKKLWQQLHDYLTKHISVQ